MSKKIVFEFELDGVRRNISSVNDLKDEIRAVNKQLGSTSANTKGYRDLQKTLGALKSIQKGVRDETKKQQRQFDITTRFAQGSYRQLNAELVNLKNQYKELGEADRNARIGRSLRRQISRLDRELKSLDENIGQYQRNVGNYAKAFNNLGGVIKGGFLAGAIAEIGRAAAQAGTALLQQSVEIDTLANKNLTVLGEAYGFVADRASEVANDLGLTTNQYIDQAAAIADVLKPIGFMEQEAAELSTQLVDLSGALAEWSGGQKTAEEAADTLQKALLGEREQLKQFGVVISEADVSARLAAKGMNNLTGEALKQAKAIATLEIIQESSIDAQKSFAENSDTLIRTQARLRAAFTDLQEQIATALIPVFGSALQAIEPLVRWFSQILPQAIAIVGSAFGPVREAVFELVGSFSEGEEQAESFTSLLRNFFVGTIRLAGNVLGDLVQGISFLIRAITNAKDANGEFRQDVSLGIVLLRSMVDIISNLPAVLNGVFEAVKVLGTAFENNFKRASLSAQVLFNEVKGLVSSSARETARQLKEQRRSIQTGGQVLADAFTKGYNDALKTNPPQASPIPEASVQRAADQNFEAGKRSADAFYEGIDQSQGQNQDTAFDQLKKQQAEIRKQIEDAAAKSLDFTDLKAQYDELGGEIERINKLFKDQEPIVQLAGGSIKVIQAEVARLKKELETADPQKIGDIAEKLVEAENKLQAAQAAINQSLREADPARQAEEAIKATEEKVQRETLLETEKLRDLQLKEEDFQEQRKLLQLNAETEILQSRIALEEEGSLRRLELEQQLADKQVEINQLKIDQIKAQEQAQLDSFLQGLEQAGQALDILGQIDQANTQNRLNALEERYQRELELAGDNEEARLAVEERFEGERRRIQRKAFQSDKRRSLLQAIINAAEAITKVLATTPFPASLVAATLVGAQTAAQIAVINAQKFEGKKGLLVKKMAAGGTVKIGEQAKGPSHAGGGIQTLFHGVPVEIEGGEHVDIDEYGGIAVINKRSSRTFKPLLDSMAKKRFAGKRKILGYINAFNGNGIPFAQQGAFIQPNITPSFQSASPPIFNSSLTLSDEDIDRLAEAIGSRVESGAMKGTQRAALTANREQERLNRLNETVG